MSWQEYHKKMQQRPLRPLYLKTASYFDDIKSSKKYALEFGFGTGQELIDLYDKKFEVCGVDGDQLACEKLTDSNMNIYHSTFELFVESEKFNNLLPVDMFCSYFSLPFCKTEQYSQVLIKTIEKIAVGGFYSVSIFGPEDEWVQSGHCAGVTREQLEGYLIDFEILHFEEIKDKRPTAAGPLKFWHIFEVIARRK